MSSRFRFFLPALPLLCFLSTLAALLSGCQSDSAPPTQVLVSIAPQKDFVRQIVGDALTVDVLVPPTANPHFFEPSPRQMMRAARSTIWFRMGEPFESTLIDFFHSRSPDMEIVDTRKGIALISCEHCGHRGHGGEDTHTWLSPKLVAMQAKTMSEALARHFPQHRTLFDRNLAVFLAKLQELDEKVAALTSTMRIRTLLLSHPSFAYFCRDYHLRQLSVEQEGREPTPRALQKLVDQIKELGIHAVFTQKQYNNKGAGLLADELGLTAIEIDPYAENYVSNLWWTAEQFARYSQ